MRPTALSALGRRTDAPPISWLMDLALERPNLVSLAAGFTDDETLPVAESRALIRELLADARSNRRALQYGSTAGLPELRDLTVRRIRDLDGATRADAARYLPERVLITHGSQQLLYLLTEVLCDPGDVVLVEDPTYFVFLGILQSHGLRCRGLRLEPDGVDLAHLENVLDQMRRNGDLPKLKLLYLVSYYQNPTATTTRLAKKTAILGLLRQYERRAGHPIYLVEDAAYREMRFAGADVPSALTAAGARERVIYLGTYSKPFATGVRVGFGLLPEALLGPVTRVKGNHDFGTCSFVQHLLVRALASGRYDSHLERLHQRYARKARTMTLAARTHFPSGVAWREPDGGLYLWARLPSGMRSGPKSALFQGALRNRVLYVPGVLCYGPDPTRTAPDHELRISFGNASLPAIERGMERLGAAIRSEQRRLGEG